MLVNSYLPNTGSAVNTENHGRVPNIFHRTRARPKNLHYYQRRHSRRRR